MSRTPRDHAAALMNRRAQAKVEARRGSIALEEMEVAGHPDCTSAEDCIGDDQSRLIRHRIKGKPGDLYCDVCWKTFKAQNPTLQGDYEDSSRRPAFKPSAAQSCPRPTQPPSRPPRHLLGQREPASPQSQRVKGSKGAGKVPRQPEHPPSDRSKGGRTPPWHEARQARPPSGPPPREVLLRSKGGKGDRPAAGVNHQSRRPAQMQPSKVISHVEFPKETPVEISLCEDVELPEFVDGMSPTTLAFSFDGKKLKLCAQADEILSRFFEDEENTIEYSEGNHQENDSWERLPEIGAALQQSVPNCVENFCIAKSTFHQIFAVGVHEKGKNRWYGSRIALAMVLVNQCKEAGEEVDLSNVPQFEQALNSCHSALPQPTSPPPQKRKLISDIATEPPRKKPVRIVPEVAESTLPRDVAFNITLPEDQELPDVIEGLATTAIAVSTEGKKKAFYSQGKQVLAHILGDEAKNVQYHQDVDWSAYPQVGAALKAIAPAEECFVIAVSPAHNVWALGVAMRAKERWAAADIALAATLAINANDGGDPVDLSGFSAFQDFLDEAYAALAAEE